jgi:hypothetical protein
METDKVLIKVVLWIAILVFCYNLMPAEDIVIESKSDYVGTTTTAKDAFGTRTCRLVTIGDTSRMTCS